MSFRLLLFWIAGILVCGLAFRSDAQAITSNETSRPLQFCIDRLHRAGLKPSTEQLALGLLFGQKSQLQKETKAEIRQAGMSHMLAVSGLHIGIIWGVLLLLFRPVVWFSVCFNADEVRVWNLLRVLIVVLLWGYIALVGFPASAQRAGLMITFTQVSVLMRRNPWGWHNLWLSALVILLLDPAQLMQVGFQLSMLATIGILAFRPLITGSGWVGSMFWLSVSAQFFTWPLCAYHFHQVPLLGWVQGFLVVPMLPVLIYALVLLFCFPMMWNGVVEVLSWWLLKVAHIVSACEQGIAGGSVYWHPSVGEVCLLELVMAAFCLLIRRYASRESEMDFKSASDRPRTAPAGWP